LGGCQQAMRDAALSLPFWSHGHATDVTFARLPGDWRTADGADDLMARGYGDENSYRFQPRRQSLEREHGVAEALGRIHLPVRLEGQPQTIQNSRRVLQLCAANRELRLRLHQRKHLMAKGEL